MPGLRDVAVVLALVEVEAELLGDVQPVVDDERDRASGLVLSAVGGVHAGLGQGEELVSGDCPLSTSDAADERSS